MGDHLGSPVDNEGRAGFLFGKSSSKGDDMVVSPGPDDQTFGGRASFSRGGGGGGVKRTKSLMQKIKSMVRRESEGDMPPMPTVAAGSRSQSMSAADGGYGYTRDPRRPSVGGAWRDAQVMEEEEEERMDTGEWSPPRDTRLDDSRGTPVSVAGRY